MQDKKKEGSSSFQAYPNFLFQGRNLVLVEDMVHSQILLGASAKAGLDKGAHSFLVGSLSNLLFEEERSFGDGSGGGQHRRLGRGRAISRSQPSFPFGLVFTDSRQRTLESQTSRSEIELVISKLLSTTVHQFRAQLGRLMNWTVGTG